MGMEGLRTTELSSRVFILSPGFFRIFVCFCPWKESIRAHEHAWCPAGWISGLKCDKSVKYQVICVQCVLEQKFAPVLLFPAEVKLVFAAKSVRQSGNMAWWIRWSVEGMHAPARSRISVW